MLCRRKMFCVFEIEWHPFSVDALKRGKRREGIRHDSAETKWLLERRWWTSRMHKYEEHIVYLYIYIYRSKLQILHNNNSNDDDEMDRKNKFQRRSELNLHLTLNYEIHYYYKYNIISYLYMQINIRNFIVLYISIWKSHKKIVVHWMENPWNGKYLLLIFFGVTQSIAKFSLYILFYRCLQQQQQPNKQKPAVYTSILLSWYSENSSSFCAPGQLVGSHYILIMIDWKTKYIYQPCHIMCVCGAVCR